MSPKKPALSLQAIRDIVNELRQGSILKKESPYQFELSNKIFGEDNIDECCRAFAEFRKVAVGKISDNEIDLGKIRNLAEKWEVFFRENPQEIPRTSSFNNDFDEYKLLNGIFNQIAYADYQKND